MEKKNPEHIEALPERITVKQLRENIDTRQDFKRELNRIKRFSKRGNEQIVTTPGGWETTKWEVREYKRDIAIDNIKKLQKVKELGYSKSQGNMGMIEQNNLNPKIPNLSKTKEEWEYEKRALRKRLQVKFDEKEAEKHKMIYLRTLQKYYDESEIDLLMRMIEKMDNEQFYNFSISTPLLSIAWQYEDAQSRKTILYGTLQEWGNKIGVNFLDDFDEDYFEEDSPV